MESINLGWSGESADRMIPVLNALNLNNLKHLDWMDGLAENGLEADNIVQPLAPNFLHKYRNLVSINLGNDNDEVPNNYNYVSNLNPSEWKRHLNVLTQFENLRYIDFSGIKLSKNAAREIGLFVSSSICKLQKLEFDYDPDVDGMDEQDINIWKEKQIQDAFTKKSMYGFLSAWYIKRLGLSSPAREMCPDLTKLVVKMIIG